MGRQPRIWVLTVPKWIAPMPVIGSLGCSSNELLDLGARSKELPLVGYAFERVCAVWLEGDARPGD